MSYTLLLIRDSLRSEFLRVFIEGMPLALPFNVDILSRNGRISEVCHLPDDITIKALNGSLTTYSGAPRARKARARGRSPIAK